MFHRVAARTEELWHERAPTTHQQRRRSLPQNAAGTGGALHTRTLWTGQRSAALGMEAIRARRQECDENDLLDGQQRMTTLLMLFACMRDMTQDQEAKKDCQNSIYQQGSQYRNIPERNRLVFAIREEVQNFIDKFVKTN